MDDAFGVGGLESRRNLHRQPKRLLDRERPAETLAERLAFDQFEHQEMRVAGLFEPMDPGDVRMTQ